MISKSISVSTQVNDLSDGAALLFTWTIPHADDFGRMPGDARVVKALVVPMREQYSVGLIESYLQEMANECLIIRYEHEGKQYISFPKWEQHQGNLHKRTVSIYPEPPCDSVDFPDIPGHSGSTKLNRREEKRREENCADAPVVVSSHPFFSHPVGKAYLSVFWPGTSMPDRWKQRAWSAAKELEAHPFYATTFGSYPDEKLVQYFTDWRDNESKWWAACAEGNTDVGRESFQFIAKSLPSGILALMDAKREAAA